MELRQLLYFITVAELLNYTKAAECLYVSQPTLSHSIAKLESEVGVKLLQRNRHEVRQTRAGALFLEHAKEILRISDVAVLEARRASTDYTGSLKIGFLPAFLFKENLPRWIQEFRGEYPNINLELCQYNSTPLYRALERGELDIGFTKSTDLKDTDNLDYKVILHDHLSIVMQRNHPLAERKTLRFSDIAGESFIMLSKQESSGYFDYVMQICKNSGFVPNVVSMPTQLETVYILTKAGSGLTVLPNSNKYNNDPELRYVEIEEEDTQIDILFAWKKANGNPLISVLREFLGTVVTRDLSAMGA
jgi:DNA-binding transcriptional LysR family regulator